MSASGTYAEILAAYCLDLTPKRIPANVIEQARLSTLDFIGVALAGSQNASAAIVTDYVTLLGGEPESTVIGSGRRVPMAHAALANGTMGHSIELDDHEAHERSYVHPGVVVMPTTWAIAEKKRTTGAEFLTAVVLGYDIIGRLSAATPPGFLDFKRGFHTTALFGPFAAGAVAGRLLGLDAGQLTNTFGILGSLCSGLFETRAAGSWAKRLHAGWAAHSGLVAAQLAARGFTGPRTVFEGNHGLYRAFVGEGQFDLGVITADLYEAFDISLIMYKPYACAGVLHSPLTAIEELLARQAFDVSEVQEVLVQSSTRLVEHFTEPRAIKYAPNSGAQGQFSLPYAVAALLVDRAALVEQFTDEAVKRPEVLAVAQRVRAEVDLALDARWPQEEPSRVIIRLNDGRVLEAEVPGGKGTLAYPMTAGELSAKFHRLATPVIGADRAAQIEGFVRRMDLETVEHLPGLMTANPSTATARTGIA